MASWRIRPFCQTPRASLPRPWPSTAPAAPSARTSCERRWPVVESGWESWGGSCWWPMHPTQKKCQRGWRGEKFGEEMSCLTNKLGFDKGWTIRCHVVLKTTSFGYLKKHTRPPVLLPRYLAADAKIVVAAGNEKVSSEFLPVASEVEAYFYPKARWKRFQKPTDCIVFQSINPLSTKGFFGSWLMFCASDFLEPRATVAFDRRPWKRLVWRLSQRLWSLSNLEHLRRRWICERNSLLIQTTYTTLVASLNEGVFRTWRWVFDRGFKESFLNSLERRQKAASLEHVSFSTGIFQSRLCFQNNDY